MKPASQRRSAARLGGLALACLALAAGADPAPPAAAASAPAPGTRTVIAVHGQLLAFTQPAGFALVGEQQQGGLYLREAVPQGESRTQWAQMLTVLAQRTSPEGGFDTPAGLVETLASAFQQACPRSFRVRPLVDAALPEGHPMFAAVLGCGAVGEGAQRRGEQVMMVVIKRAELYFALQWAERTPAQDKAPEFRMEQWAQRFHQLAPYRVCDRLPGERPPYPSCR